MTLIIREPQMDVFQRAADIRFSRQLAALLHREHPDCVKDLSVAAIEEQSLQAINRATSYGLKNNRDVLVFVLMTFVVSPNFDEHPAFRRILTDDYIPDEEKMPLIFSRVNGVHWNAAAKMVD
jgi:hypothetical protein